MSRFGKDMLSASAVAFATYLTVNALLPRTEPPVGTDRAENRYFRNCSEAHAAGAAPIEPGEPGYRDALDRDGDGIACEPLLRR